jgi:propanol-preferring alcohol dehydrogenase
VVALAEAGRVEPQIERYPLDQVIDVYEKLEKGEIAGRAVLSP